MHNTQIVAIIVILVKLQPKSIRICPGQVRVMAASFRTLSIYCDLKLRG